MANDKILGLLIKATDKSEPAFDSVENSVKSVGNALVDTQKKGHSLEKGLDSGMRNVAQGISVATRDMHKLSSGLRNSGKEASKMASETKLVNSEMNKIAQSSAKIEKLSASALQSANRIRNLKQEVRSLRSELDKIKSQPIEVKPAPSKLNDKASSLSLGGLASGAVAFGAAALGAAALARGILDTAIAAERLDRVLVTVTGSQEGAAREMRYLKGLSRDLGLEFRGLSADYASVMAASKGTKLEGEGIRKVYTSVASASAALGLSADDTSGVLRALTQMISKGKVQAEELRGQLGERLPGAFQIAARAMGLSTAELDKFLQLGLITAEQMLPAFARQLDKEYGEAGKRNAKSLQGSINSIKNEWEELKKSFADKTMVDAFKDILRGLKDVADETKLVIQAIKGYSELIGEISAGGSKQEDFSKKIRDQYRFQSPEKYDEMVAQKEKELQKLEKRSKTPVSKIGGKSDLLFNPVSAFDTDGIKKEIENLKQEKRGLVILLDQKKESDLNKQIDNENRSLARVQRSVTAGIMTDKDAAPRIEEIRSKIKSLKDELVSVQDKLGNASGKKREPLQTKPTQDHSIRKEVAGAAAAVKQEKPVESSPVKEDTEAKAIGDKLRADAKKAETKNIEASLKKQAEAIRNQFRSETEMVREQIKQLEELYAKKDSLGQAYLSQEDYGRAKKFLEEKEALSLVDKEMQSLRDEVDTINRSFMTQSERLEEVKSRLKFLYDAGAFEDAQNYEKALKRINEEIAKAKTEETGKPKESEWSKLSSGFKDAWKESIKSVGDELKKMVKEGEFSLSRLKNAMLDTLTGKIIDKTIDIGINALLGGGISGWATGGFPDPNKPYFAGERGTELIIPSGQSHRVFNAADTKRIMESGSAAGGPAYTINNHIAIQGNADDNAIMRMIRQLEERIPAMMIDYQRRGMA